MASKVIAIVCLCIVAVLGMYIFGKCAEKGGSGAKDGR